MAFEPGKKFRTAIDKETGAVVAVRDQGASTEFKMVDYPSLEGPSLNFEVFIKWTSGEPNAIFNVPTLEGSLRIHALNDEVIRERL